MVLTIPISQTIYPYVYVLAVREVICVWYLAAVYIASPTSSYIKLFLDKKFQYCTLSFCYHKFSSVHALSLVLNGMCQFLCIASYLGSGQFSFIS
jgi:hypothetical protein